MTNQNTAAANEASNDRQQGPKWPQRFGTVKRVQIKNGRKGKYAILTVDCKKFEQVAFAFSAKVVEQIEAAGVGASVWFKGPMEPVEGSNGVETDQMKVVYFKNKSAETGEGDQPEAAEDDAPVAAEPQDLTAIKGIGAAAAEQLTAAGITNYAELADASDEALDAAKAGMAKRATSGDWRGQAAAMVAEAKAAAEAEANAKIDDEIPF